MDYDDGELEWRLKKAFDQVVNRIKGIYLGYSPKFPTEIPRSRFAIIDTKIDSIDDTVSTALEGYRFDRPLVVSDPNVWDKYSGQTGLEKYPVCIIASNDFFEVQRIVELGVSKSTNNRIFETLIFPWVLAKGIKKKFRKHCVEYCGEKNYNIIYAFGGGTCIDVAQFAAKMLNIPWVSIPTSLANDGFASQFSVLNTDSGVQTLPANVPFGIIVDTSKIVSDDPHYKRRINAGIADLTSNITACLDWDLASSITDSRCEKINPIIRAMSIDGALCLLDELKTVTDHYYDPYFLKKLAARLILSGRAMGEYGSSRPASGFEHKLYHAHNEVTHDTSRAMHGEVVAVGTLLSAVAHDRLNQTDFYSRISQAFCLLGLPAKAHDFERFNIDWRNIKTAIVSAKDVKPDRYTILEHCNETRGQDYMLGLFDDIFR